MRAKAILFLCSFFLLASCSGDPGMPFPIASGPLKPQEIALNSFGQSMLAARVFDVVNQDLTAANNTGLAGGVQPMPVDILSAYAAGKFRAAGGPYTVRFLVRQGSLKVRGVHTGDSGMFSSGEDKAELSVDLSVMVAASRMGGAGATITASTTQSQQTPFTGTPEEHRAVYMALMVRALAALDAELTRQLPTYFSAVLSR